MADPIVVTPGKDTSEFSVTKLLIWIGSGVTIASTAVEAGKEIIAALEKVPAAASGPALYLALIGAAIALIPSLYFKFTRLQLKKAAINAAAAGAASDAKAALDAS